MQAVIGDGKCVCVMSMGSRVGTLAYPLYRGGMSTIRIRYGGGGEGGLSWRCGLAPANSVRYYTYHTYRNHAMGGAVLNSERCVTYTAAVVFQKLGRICLIYDVSKSGFKVLGLRLWDMVTQNAERRTQNPECKF